MRKTIGMKVLLGKKRINLLGVIAGVITIVGLFNPWIYRRTNPWFEWNPKERRTETFYHIYANLSPFFFSVIRDGMVVSKLWFVDFGTSIAGVILLCTSVLCAFRFEQKEVNLYLFLISILAIFIFIFNLGSGLRLGIYTFTGQGFKLTLIGLTFMFVSSLAELLS